MVTKHPSLAYYYNNTAQSPICTIPLLTTVSGEGNGYSDRRLRVETITPGPNGGTINYYSVPFWDYETGTVQTRGCVLVAIPGCSRACFTCFFIPTFCMSYQTCSVASQAQYQPGTYTTFVKNLQVKIIDQPGSSGCPISLRCPIYFYFKNSDSICYCIGCLSGGYTTFSPSTFSFANGHINTLMCGCIEAQALYNNEWRCQIIGNIQYYMYQPRYGTFTCCKSGSNIQANLNYDMWY
jgi:hypothetical protein